MSILDCEKLTLAKVRGVAYGMGVNLALACDMVFAARSARLCDSHVKAGMVAGDGGVMLWPLLCGIYELYSIGMNDFREATSSFMEKRPAVFKGN